MSAPLALSGTAEGVVKRFYLKDGSLLQLRHTGGFTEATLYWYNTRTTPKRVERNSARFQSLVGAIRAVLKDAKMTDTAEEIARYVHSTRWGEGWPN